MKVYFVKDIEPTYLFATSADESDLSIECTPEERATRDKAERLFFDLQKWIEERIEKSE